jgi:sensor histidine kinase YesM
MELSSRLTYPSALLLDMRLLADILLPFFAGLFSFYSFYSYLVPRILAKKRGRLFIFCSIALCFTVALLSLGCFYLLSLFVPNTPLHFSASLFINSLLTYLIIGGYFALIALINGIVATLFKASMIWYSEIHLKETLTKKNLQTQLALLKAQLNPHFLFNTLHNIDILIEKDATKASLYLNKLSQMLRFIIYESPLENIPLSRELAYIDQYVELQKIRTTNQSFVQLEVVGNREHYQIAPMLFISLVENAFKHCTNKKQKDAIRIIIVLSGKKIHFTCSNLVDKAARQEHPQGGLGLTLIRQRLELLYKNAYSLDIQQKEAIFQVNLTLHTNGH